MKRLPTATARRRRAAAAVEFALVAPLFILVLFGIIEIGRAIMAQNALINASREAARTAALDGATPEEIEELAASYARLGTINGVEVQIEPADLSSSTSNTVTVTLSVPFEQVSWLPMPQFLKDRTLTASTTMRRESYDVSDDVGTVATTSSPSTSTSGASDPATTTSTTSSGNNGNGNGNGNGKNK